MRKMPICNIALKPPVFDIPRSALFAFVLLSSTAPVSAQLRDEALLGDRLVVPGERIGNLRLSPPLSHIISSIGDAPNKESAGPSWPASTYHSWEREGVAVIANNDTGNILWISVESGRPTRWERATTREGMGIGATGAQLIAGLGTPSREFMDQSGKSVYFDQKGVRFFLATTGPQAGRVVGVRVVWPHATLGDGVIVPGERIGALALDVSLDEALKIVGGGFAKHQAGEITNYNWLHRGIRISAKDNQILGMAVLSTPFLEGAGVKYATADGLRIGNTEADVVAVLGEPPARSKDGSAQWLIYRAKGIAFGVDGQSRVGVVEIIPNQQSYGRIIWYTLIGALVVLLTAAQYASKYHNVVGLTWIMRIATPLMWVIFGLAILAVAVELIGFLDKPFGWAALLVGAAVMGLFAFSKRNTHRRLLNPLQALLEPQAMEMKLAGIFGDASHLAGRYGGHAVRISLKERDEDGPSEFAIAMALNVPALFEIRRRSSRDVLRNIFGTPFHIGDAAMDDNYVVTTPQLDSGDLERMQLAACLRSPATRESIESLLGRLGAMRIEARPGWDQRPQEKISTQLMGVYSPYEKSDVSAEKVRDVLVALQAFGIALQYK